MALPSDAEDDVGLAALTSFSPRGALGFFAAGAFLAWIRSVWDGGIVVRSGRDGTAVIVSVRGRGVILGACTHLGRRGDVLVDRDDLSDVHHDAR